MNRLLKYLLPAQLPVIKTMPPHVRDLNLDIGLLLFQMEEHRCHKSAAVNNSPHMSVKEKG